MVKKTKSKRIGNRMTFSNNEKLSQTYECIVNAINEFDSKQLNMITPVCKRSLAQIVYHLVCYENIYVTILFRKLLFNYDLSIKLFTDIDLSDIYLEYDVLKKWLVCLKRERSNNIAMLSDYKINMETSKLNHEVHGKLGIGDVVKKIVLHDEHHYKQIMDIASFLREDEG